MTYRQVSYELAGPVATITLNRPESLNAITRELEAELHDALDEADQDTRVRAVVLTGAGRAFSAGFDLSQEGDRKDGPPAPDTATPEDMLSYWQRRNRTETDHLLHIWKLSKPVIAAVNGYCMGGGLWYQLACDISIASERAVFGQPEVRMVSSTSFLFASIAGWKDANRYALTGDHFDAREALRMRVVNEVVPHDELVLRALELGNRIALVPEASVRMNKAVTMIGSLVSGLENGLNMNAFLNAIVHSSHGSDRARFDEALQRGGMRELLRTRDEPFLPEPFGPKSRARGDDAGDGSRRTSNG